MAERKEITNNLTSRQNPNLKQKDLAVVSQVILSNEDVNQLGSLNIEYDDDIPFSEYFGHIIAVRYSNLNEIVGGLLIPPYNEDDTLPIVNQVVRIIYEGDKIFYKNLSNGDLNAGNFLDDRLDVLVNQRDSKSNSTNEYREISSTGISNSNVSNSTQNTNKYFEPNWIFKLRGYEGDKLIQSRFGQSIRFSGYNNPENTFSPTIVLRNRQSDELLNDTSLNRTDLIEEDVNQDGTTIVLSSRDYIINYQTEVETNPINFQLPDEYSNYDQFFVNSDRIIFSSKSQEMIFFSKGDYGFISDGTFNIDNGTGGANLDFGDDVNITTDRNNSNFSVQTGTGNILLNTTQQTEPLIRGEQLVSFLRTLTNILIQFQTIGPNGTNTTLPNIQTQISQLQAELENLKSTRNFTE